MTTEDWRDWQFKQPRSFDTRSLPKRIIDAFTGTVQAIGFLLLDSKEQDNVVAEHGNPTAPAQLHQSLGRLTTQTGDTTPRLPH